MTHEFLQKYKNLMASLSNTQSVCWNQHVLSIAI